MTLPLVSVLVITYNQEKYIAECLNSLVRQKTNFDFEIVVCDDVSKDNTVEIARALSVKDQRIQVYRNEKNLGPAGNFAKALSLCKGRYIAFCEGDDFWCDDLKLEKQVEILQNDGELTMVYADYGKVDDKGNILENKTIDKPEHFFTLSDFIDGSGPVLNSMMLRREIFPKQFPKAFFTVLNPDVFIIGWTLLKGQAKFIPDVLSMYRTHSEGIYSSKTTIEKQLLRYSTRMEFFKSLTSGYRNYYLIALKKLEETLAAAKKNSELKLFKKYFPMLPAYRRFIFNLKQWYYALRTA